MFVLASDLHLDPLIWSDRPQIHGDAYRAFAQIVDYAIRMAEPLLLAGDLADKKRPSPQTVACIFEQMDRMQRAGLPVYFVQGQHELDRDVPWFTIHPWPQYVHRKTFTIAGRQFYGLDWLPRGWLQEELQQIPAGAEFLLCHQVWEEFMGTNCATDGTMAAIPHVKYVLTGDYHKHLTAEFTGGQGSVTAVSCGSTHLREIGGEYPHAFYHAASRPSGVVFHDVALESRELQRLTVETPEQLDVLQRRLADLVERPAELRPIYSIRIRDDLPSWHLRLTTAVGDRGHLFFDQFMVPADVEVSAQIVIPQNTTPTAAMSNAAQVVVADNPAVLAKVQGLLSHQDKAGAAAYWRELHARHMAATNG